MPRHGKVKHGGCASTTHATQNAFLRDLTQGCVHTAKWITTPGKQSNAEMEDTCKNKAGLLQREPKAPADVLFISTLITDCCGMVLWTGKEKLTHCLLRTSFHRSRLWGSCWQGLRHETTTPSWERYGLRKQGPCWNTRGSTILITSLSGMKMHKDSDEAIFISTRSTFPSLPRHNPLRTPLWDTGGSKQVHNPVVEGNAEQPLLLTRPQEQKTSEDWGHWGSAAFHTSLRHSTGLTS